MVCTVIECIFKIFIFIKKMFLHLFIFERQSVSRGGAEREREIQNQEQALGLELSAQSPK